MLDLKLKRLSRVDGTWDELLTQWKQLCEQYGENFGDFNSGTISMLGDVCGEVPPNPNQGTFGLIGEDSKFHGICLLNLTLQKGYDGLVLRVLNFSLSPYYDFEDLQLEEYSSVLAAYFVNLVVCSNTQLKSKHIKIHYRSPYDRHFFASVAPHLSGVGQLATVETRGMWLSVTKA